MNVEQSTPRCINELCSLLGFSRQAFYQHKREEEKEVLGEDLIVQAEDGIRDLIVTGVQTCALPI